MPELDARKQIILRALVFEYVRAAEPVGSELIVQNHDLGVRSATVRNELAEMAELGYLEQPHTSAGRIPSDRGFRYYVDRLVIEIEPDEATRQQVKEKAGEGEVLQDLLRDTTALLSRLTKMLAAATIVKDQNVVIRNALVSAIGPNQALLVMVLSNGTVENRLIECPTGLSLEDVGRTNEMLAQAVNGKTLRMAMRLKTPAVAASDGQNKFMASVWTAIRAVSKERTRGTVVTEGEEFMVAQPEFQRDVRLLSEVLDSLGDDNILYDALQLPVEQGKSITIGLENRPDALMPLSIIRRSFYVGENEAGVIAVIGPKRMPYDTSIPLVSFTAQALSEALTKFLGST